MLAKIVLLGEFMAEKKIVFPGETLTVVEEFISGKNTFEDDEGNIKAARVGEPVFDEEEREVFVKSKGGKVKLRRGAVVFGVVEKTSEKHVLIKMLHGYFDGKPVYFHETFARLGIASASERYLKSMRDEFRIGDFVKAEVEKVTKFSVDLSTKGKEFGVVKAFCAKCRKELELVGGKLVCPGCKFFDHRIVAESYGKE